MGILNTIKNKILALKGLDIGVLKSLYTNRGLMNKVKFPALERVNLQNKMSDKVFYNILISLFFVTATIVLALSVRGLHGTPLASEVIQKNWTINGPLELSPERGRFALTYSMLEDKSFQFSTDIARLAVPDLGYSNGDYVSLFAPTVSFIVAPGYMIGKYFDISQVGSYAVISLFALINALLIQKISISLGANKYLALFSSLVFLFASPAFAYATTLYQHHISVFLILLGLYVYLKYDTFLSLTIIWFLCALSISVDNPNLFMMFPIGIAGITKIIQKHSSEDKVKVVLKPLRVFTFVGLIPPILFFMWFNYASYGDPMQLGGTVPSVRAIDDNGLPTSPRGVDVEDLQKYKDPSKQDKSAVGFFKTRNILNGLYLHLISPDRGMINFTPVLLVPLVGIMYLYKKNEKHLPLLVSIISVNVLLYSLWGDPWGGWAFGSRYLIPTYAILAILLALILTKYKKLWLLGYVFFLFVWSVRVNTFGALTPIGNPPQVEVLKLEELSGLVQKYTYQRNIDAATFGDIRSYAYGHFFASDVQPLDYVNNLTLIIVIYSSLVLTRHLYVEMRGNRS